jgi:conjugative transfer signal peptidase TraF
MNYDKDFAAPFFGPACWPLHCFLDSSRAGFSASVLISHPPSRAASTSRAIRPAQTLWSSASISLGRQYRAVGACPDGGAPLLKPAVAFPGDQVQVSADGIRVNGQLLPNSAGRFRDHWQRPLDPWPYGTYKVIPGTVWVVSSFNSYSFDSRYFGAIPQSSIRHHLRPFWTFATEVPQR